MAGITRNKFAFCGGEWAGELRTLRNFMKKENLLNWAGNIRYSTDHIFYPKTVSELQTIVITCGKLTALGSTHSFNRIADNGENLVSMKRLNRLLEIDTSANTATIEGGARYGDIVEALHEAGYALPNLASLPHITVAGACATATHGSGIENGNLSTAVSALEFVNAAGDLVCLSREKDGEDFYGAVVGLGALGVVTKITLDLVPAFEITQSVYLDMPMLVLKDHFEDIQAKGYSVSLFADWQDELINQVWVKSAGRELQTAAADFYGATLATSDVHPVVGQSSENVTPQQGIPGPWYARLPHFKMGFKPSAGKELQTEYFVPVEHAYEAMMAIAELREHLAPHILVSEVRTVKADQLWMSPCYKRSCVAFHFTWKQHVEAVMALLPLIEQQLEPFQAIPHWAKLFTMDPAVLQSRYERLNDFRRLVKQHDPTGKFQNDFLTRNIFG
jgi:xylitol oxidase